MWEQWLCKWSQKWVQPLSQRSQVTYDYYWVNFGFFSSSSSSYGSSASFNLLFSNFAFKIKHSRFKIFRFFLCVLSSGFAYLFPIHLLWGRSHGVWQNWWRETLCTVRRQGTSNRPVLFNLYVLFSQLEVPGELAPWSFHKLCVHMPVNKTKFQRNSSLEYYDTWPVCIGKTKVTS